MAFFDIDTDEIEALFQEPEADRAEPGRCDEVVQRCNKLSEIWNE